MIRGIKDQVARAFLMMVFAVPMTVLAQQVDTINTLRELVNQGQYQRAFELGQAAEERYEGRAEFDFHYGLAALETGRY
ncbi:MAG: hypothetical protein JJT88_18085, partial [Gammaproteobacteria bacterium]|nr:hypothetical protein [Gammaproteobacteria bacterium]